MDHIQRNDIGQPLTAGYGSEVPRIDNFAIRAELIDQPLPTSFWQKLYRQLMHRPLQGAMQNFPKPVSIKN